MKSNLIIGENSQIGSEIVKQINADCFRTTRKEVNDKNVILYDIRNDIETCKLDLNKIRNAFICIGYTNVGFCQQNPKESEKINLERTLKLVRSLNKIQVKCTLFSSEYVYDGLSDQAYTEETIKSANTVYGRQKAILEDEIKDDNQNLIFRISKLASMRNKKSFLKKMALEMHGNNEYNAAVDQIFTPICTSDAARVIVEISKSSATGLFNLCGEETISRYSLAQIIKRKLRLPITITKVKIGDIKLSYKVAKNLSMSNAKIKRYTSVKLRSLAEIISDKN